VGENNGIAAAMRALARLHRVLEATDSGLTLPQYRMLTALSEGGERSARLAERLTIRKPTVTALADGLVAAGYAERSSEPGDRRIVRLHITDDGQRCVQALIAIGEGLDRRARRTDTDARPASSRAEVDGRSAGSRAEART
jgi:DNA-binding MarR family transcriptional regulator